MKPRTTADYRRLLDRHLLPTFGDKPLRRITADDVSAWYLSMNAQTPTERAHAYQLFRAILTTAADPKVRLISQNPCQIDGAGQVSRAHEVRTASMEELATITSAMPKRLSLAVLLGAWCALRYGEIAELRRKDVDVRNGIIKVRRGVTWPNGKPTVGTPKSTSGARDVHVPPHIMPMIKAHLKDHTAPKAEALLFPALSGEYLHPRTFGKNFDKARDAAGRADLHFHDLQHTGAVLAAQTGATLAELMARLGHSTPGAAMRYQHAASDRDKAIAARLSALAAVGV
ncbi:MAG: tyrosine-type recombinase/integrase [Propionicimonas sp.]|nr:tyrosine-type recombinase/integrase [Propionicimonas sp.]